MKIKRNGRSICCCCAALLALAIASPVSARLLVTDFSEGAIDAMAISAAEGERRIDNGALLMRSRAKGAATGYARTWQWATDETWSTTAGMTQASVTVDSIDLGTSSNKIAFAQLAGFFYNTRVAPGDAEGDVFVQLIVGDRGNGLEVWYEIETSLNAAFTDSSTSNGVVIAPGSLSLGGAVTLKLEYDGARTFTFTANGTAVSADGPLRLDTPYYTGRGLRTGIDSLVPTDDMIDDGSAAQIVAHFDNVIVDDLAYDDFAAADIDRSKWFRGKMLSTISTGALRIEADTPDTTTERIRINLQDVESNLVEAALELNSASNLPSGTQGRVRIQGYWYNDTFNAPPLHRIPGQYLGTIDDTAERKWKSSSICGGRAIRRCQPYYGH